MTRAYLCWRVIEGDLDGLAHRADVDHHQDVAVIDLKEGANGEKKPVMSYPNL